MKKVRNIFIVLLCMITYSCNDCKENIKVRNIFHNHLKIISNYDLYEGELNDSLLAEFYFSSNYLEEMTKISPSFIFAEPPHYLSRENCLSDISKWERWYKNNKCNISIEISDSISQIVYNKRIWW